MDMTISDAGSQLALEKCNTCCRNLFHCPLCPTFKPARKAKIETHIRAHMKNAIHFKGKSICRCRLPCRAEGHYHCPFCQKTIIRRNCMERHLIICQGCPPAVTSLASAPTPITTYVRPLASASTPTAVTSQASTPKTTSVPHLASASTTTAVTSLASTSITTSVPHLASASTTTAVTSLASTSITTSVPHLASASTTTAVTSLASTSITTSVPHLASASTTTAVTSLASTPKTTYVPDFASVVTSLDSAPSTDKGLFYTAPSWRYMPLVVLSEAEKRSVLMERHSNPGSGKHCDMVLSVCDAGSQPAVEKCSTCCRNLFHCPLCPTFKPARKAKIETHIRAHMKNAIHFKGKRICRCRLPCRAEGHYHCPFCQKTIIRRNCMERHLIICQGCPPAVTSLASAPTPITTYVRPLASASTPTAVTSQASTPKTTSVPHLASASTTTAVTSLASTSTTTSVPHMASASTTTAVTSLASTSTTTSVPHLASASTTTAVTSLASTSTTTYVRHLAFASTPTAVTLLASTPTTTYVRHIASTSTTTAVTSLDSAPSTDNRLFYTAPSWRYMPLVVLSEAEKRSVLMERHSNPGSGKHCDIKGSHRCQLNDPIKTVVPVLHTIKLEEAWDVLGLDLIGPLPETARHNKFVITMTDLYTKWVIAEPLQSKAVNEVSLAITTKLCMFGMVRHIITDQDKEFIKELNDSIFSRLKIKNAVSSVYHPQPSGQDELSNQDIKRTLRKYMNESNNDWDLHLPVVVYGVNTAKQNSTRQSPYFLLFHRHPRLLEVTSPCPKAENLEVAHPEEDTDSKVNEMKPLSETVLSNVERVESEQQNSVEDQKYAPNEGTFLQDHCYSTIEVKKEEP
ncbi:mucin-5AC-like isoform X2 [Brienomyrus brachyistius]|uniref:mucin-5AC-like isoform X2 n=1 Tax=Brienomyrus brachyistius TaxID=42636 RepID=UPI0020B18745|nr:mucin-5AC-like isoform X2 [Brienomyrus brachyistius]